MLLALLGRPLSRQDAHRHFGTRRRDWTPPDIATVAATLRPLVDERLVVLTEARFTSAESLAAALEDRLHRVPALLMAARCRLLPERVSARHAVVVTGVSEARIAVVDPLCRPPEPGTRSNNAVHARPEHRRHLRTDAGLWELDLWSSVDLLEISSS